MKLKQNNRQRSINEHFGADKSVRISVRSISRLFSPFPLIFILPRKRERERERETERIFSRERYAAWNERFSNPFHRWNRVPTSVSVILNRGGRKEKLGPRFETRLTKTRYVKSASVFIAALNLREKKLGSKRGAIQSPPWEAVTLLFSSLLLSSVFSFSSLNDTRQFRRIFHQNKKNWFFFCCSYLSIYFYISIKNWNYSLQRWCEMKNSKLWKVSNILIEEYSLV